MPTKPNPRKIKNLAVYSTDPCGHCSGAGKSIDDGLTGARVKRERERAGLTQDVVAKAMCISAPYLSDLERGTRPWSLALLESVGTALASITKPLRDVVEDAEAPALR